MKTIVLFFLLIAVATASRKHKTKASESDVPESSTDWPRPETIGDFSVPPEYGGPPPIDGDEPSPPAGNDLSGRRFRSGRRH